MKTIRETLFESTGGLCFYCGQPVVPQKFRDRRDWLNIDRRRMLVREHAQPLRRDGADTTANTVPACPSCNWLKDAFTLEEFRLCRGLRSGNPTARFACEAGPPSPREWLCVHSPGFERPLILHQFPEAIARYQKVLGTWADR